MSVSVPKTRFDTVRGSFANIGVRQFGDPILERKTRRIKLPIERPLAAEIIDCLLETIKRARELHEFTRGIGLAAPQIGIPRRVAIVQPVGQLPIRLINPRIVHRSHETTLAFEGCLSFFDYRGEVRRPTAITVESHDLNGRLVVISLEGEAARLAMHEIDHLDGRLYIHRMAAGARLIAGDALQP